MGFLGFEESVAHQDALLKHLVATYQRLRPERLRLNQELVRRLSRDVLEEGGKRLGILRDGVFVFRNEDETSVLMDYCIYNVYRQGRNAVDVYICDSPLDPDSDESICLRAMQSATYAVVAVLSVEPGVGCHVRNLFTEETWLLVDIGFSQTAQPGAIIATRLLDFGSYVATGGAALPMGILDEARLAECQATIIAGMDDAGFDPAPLIRACLRSGASSAIRYEESDARRLPDTANPKPTRSLSQRRKALAQLTTRKSLSNRRCACGSGKMFKNCCGK
jgi:hypothetical protein